MLSLILTKLILLSAIMSVKAFGSQVVEATTNSTKMQRSLQTLTRDNTFEQLNVKVVETALKSVSSVDVVIKPKSQACTSSAYIMITMPGTVTLMSQLSCKLVVNTSLSMSLNTYCIIIGNQVQINEPFSSVGYYPQQDGAMRFTVKDVLVNGESNSFYGDFRVDIFDYLTIRHATLVVSGMFANTQQISPLDMTFLGFALFNSTQGQTTTIQASSMNNTYNMRFTIGYLAYSSSKLSISIPSGIALIAPPYLFLPGQALNVTLQAWNATYCDFLVNFGKTLAPGTNLSMNLTGSNSAPRQMYPDLTFKLSLSNPSTNVLIQKCETAPIPLSPAEFASPTNINMKTSVTTLPTSLLVAFNSSVKILTNDTLQIKIAEGLPFEANTPLLCQGQANGWSASIGYKVMPCAVIAGLNTIVIQLDQFLGYQIGLIDISGGFTNPLSNKTVSGFEISMVDAQNYVVQKDTLINPVQSQAVKDVTDMTLYSTNSSYMAISTYTIVLGTLPKQLPMVTYMRMMIADCFGLNFTSLVVRLGRSDGTNEYISPTRYQNRNNQFYFALKNVANFSFLPVANSLPPDSCAPNNRYFNLYNYEDANLTNMIFKTEGVLEPALECLNDCQSCRPSNKSYCTLCINQLLAQEGQCREQCGVGFYQQGFQCLPCSGQCDQCSSSYNCLSCSLKHYLLFGNCLDQCPSFYYQNATSAQCHQCCSNCQNCTNSQVCNQCEPGYYSYQGTCQLKCPNFDETEYLKCIVINNTFVNLNLLEDLFLVKVENSISGLNFLNFLPSTLMMIGAGIMTGVSFLMEKKTKVWLLLLIQSQTIEVLSSFLICVFGFSYYAKGMHSILILPIYHGSYLIVLSMVNYAVLHKFKLAFKLEESHTHQKVEEDSSRKSSQQSEQKGIQDENAAERKRSKREAKHIVQVQDWVVAHERGWKGLNGLACVFTFNYLRLIETKFAGSKHLQLNFFINNQQFKQNLTPVLKTQMALKLATLCLNLFFMVAVIGFIKISYVMVESCSLITLQIGILFLQIKVDDAREIELFRSQYEKSVQLNQAIFYQLQVAADPEMQNGNQDSARLSQNKSEILGNNFELLKQLRKSLAIPKDFEFLDMYSNVSSKPANHKPSMTSGKSLALEVKKQNYEQQESSQSSHSEANRSPREELGQTFYTENRLDRTVDNILATSTTQMNGVQVYDHDKFMPPMVSTATIHDIKEDGSGSEDEEAKELHSEMRDPSNFDQMNPEEGEATDRLQRGDITQIGPQNLHFQTDQREPKALIMLSKSPRSFLSPDKHARHQSTRVNVNEVNFDISNQTTVKKLKNRLSVIQEYNTSSITAVGAKTEAKFQESSSPKLVNEGSPEKSERSGQGNRKQIPSNIPRQYRLSQLNSAMDRDLE